MVYAKAVFVFDQADVSTYSLDKGITSKLKRQCGNRKMIGEITLGL